jgi:RNA-splicing ligase RtcB
MQKIEIVNVPYVPVRIKFDARELRRLVLLPDHSPGVGLDIGTVAVFNEQRHKINPKLLGADVGCGMKLAKFNINSFDFKALAYSVASELRTNPLYERPMGLGGGNHFINIYSVSDSRLEGLRAGDLVVLIHTGAGLDENKGFNMGVGNEEYFKYVQKRMVDAEKNRQKLLRLVESSLSSNGITTPIFDAAHNTICRENGSIVYRKGAVKIITGGIAVIPSSFAGEALIVRANDAISRLSYSMCHGTGRVIRRADTNHLTNAVEEARRGVYIPDFINSESLCGESPTCYRSASDVFEKLKPFVSLEARLRPLAFISQ